MFADVDSPGSGERDSDHDQESYGHSDWDGDQEVYGDEDWDGGQDTYGDGEWDDDQDTYGDEASDGDQDAAIDIDGADTLSSTHFTGFSVSQGTTSPYVSGAIPVGRYTTLVDEQS